MPTLRELLRTMEAARNGPRPESLLPWIGTLILSASAGIRQVLLLQGSEAMEVSEVAIATVFLSCAVALLGVTAWQGWRVWRTREQRAITPESIADNYERSLRTAPPQFLGTPSQPQAGG